MSGLEDKQRKAMLARRIREVRTAKGLSGEDLGALLNITQPCVSQYEAGITTITLDVLINLCDALGCSVDYLLGRDVDYSPETPRGRLLKAFDKMPVGFQELLIQMLEGIK